MMTKGSLSLLWYALLPLLAAGFQVLPQSVVGSCHIHSHTALSVNPNAIVEPEESERRGISPNQIKTLRKEASKRLARKLLVQRTFENDNDSFDEFLQRVCQDLDDNELVQVRGVSLEDKRLVYQSAHQLAYDLSVVLQRGITVVQIQGHAVTLFSPSSDPKKRKMLLRTSFQEGAWTPREKAPRDHRGQIVKE
ncbi:expressed unknown protein [Seminavis robusta]|uniref:CRM domain-containing protein n=1 Tax=Seminavis robusta TaxID=568900 RepID=A0A9N8HQY3_9STRA|nr:expressed unknown protein [Seminavis robusta]|eukprot:Sro1337_g264170.1 n/a (194) ;mRNA; f:26312-26893